METKRKKGKVRRKRKKEKGRKRRKKEGKRKKERHHVWAMDTLYWAKFSKCSSFGVLPC